MRPTGRKIVLKFHRQCQQSKALRLGLRVQCQLSGVSIVASGLRSLSYN